MRALLVLLILARVAHAETATSSVVEIPDSIGPVVGVTFDGRPSVGGTGRLAFGPRLGVDAQVRTRDGGLVASLELAWTMTHGELENLYGARRRHPLTFTTLVGAGILDRTPAVTFGVALRVRAVRWLSIDLIVREAIARAAERPHELMHVPEVQLAVSLTAANERMTCYFGPPR